MLNRSTRLNIFRRLPEPMLYTEVKVGDGEARKLDLLLDSGSDVDLISESVAKQWSQEWKNIKELREAPWSIVTANGAKSVVQFFLEIDIRIGEVWMRKVRVYILKSLPSSVVVGNE